MKHIACTEKQRFEVKERSYVVDFLRLVAILAVVLIHTTNTSMQLGYYKIDLMPLSFFLNHFARFAVGTFFAISGFLLAARYNPQKSVFNFYKRRLSKLLIPYIVWSAIYHISIYDFKVTSVFSVNFLQNLLSGNASYQLYFIPTIIVLYFFFPLFMKFKKIFFSDLFLGVFFTTQLLLLLYMYTTLDSFKILLHPTLRNAFINSLPFLIGAAVGLSPDLLKTAKKIKWVILLIAVGSLSTMLWETKEMFSLTRNPEFVRSQWRITSPIYALSMCLVLASFYNSSVSKLHGKLKEKVNKYILLMSNHSMGVYFAHVAVISLFWRLLGSYLYSLTQGHVVYTLWFDVLQFFAVTSISFVGIYILGKIPVVRDIVGAK